MFTALLVVALWKFDVVLDVLKAIWGILFPFVLGICLLLFILYSSNAKAPTFAPSPYFAGCFVLMQLSTSVVLLKIFIRCVFPCLSFIGHGYECRFALWFAYVFAEKFIKFLFASQQFGHCSNTENFRFAVWIFACCLDSFSDQFFIGAASTSSCASAFPPTQTWPGRRAGQ